METNEDVKAALWHHAEMEVQKVMERVQGLADGDLKGLEEQVMATVFALGRAWMESLLSSQQHSERPAARRLGACGHEQRLVGERPKQVLTLLGKVTMRRAYYQCLIEEAEETTCTHGEAPADALWGVHERRTTAGVRASHGKPVRLADPARSRRHVQSPVAVRDVCTPGTDPDATDGRGIGTSGRRAGEGDLAASGAGPQ